jgi:hypothetical protein
VQVAHPAHHPRGTVGHRPLQPVAEQVRDLARQAQRNGIGKGRARVAPGGHHRLKLVVGQRRDQGRYLKAHRNARAGQPLDRQKPPLRRGRPRLHPPCQIVVQRGDADRYGGQPLGRHGCQKVKVALDQRPARGDPDRMAKGRKHPQHPAQDGMVTLHRLVGIGVRPDRQWRGPVAWSPQFLIKHPGDAGPGDQPGFEVEPRRQVQKGMGRPGIAVDAAMLAAPVGVERPVERQVGRGLPGDRRPWPFDPHLGPDQAVLLGDVPAVVKGIAVRGLEPAGAVAVGPAPAQALAGKDAGAVVHGARLEHSSNMFQSFPRGDGFLSAFIRCMSLAE